MEIRDGKVGLKYVTQTGKIILFRGFKNESKSWARVFVELTGKNVAIPGDYEVEPLFDSIAEEEFLRAEDSRQLSIDGIPQEDDEEQKSEVSAQDKPSSPAPNRTLRVAKPLSSKILSKVTKNGLEYYVLEHIVNSGLESSKEDINKWAKEKGLFGATKNDKYVGQRVSVVLSLLKKKDIIEVVGRGVYKVNLNILEEEGDEEEESDSSQ